MLFVETGNSRFDREITVQITTVEESARGNPIMHVNKFLFMSSWSFFTVGIDFIASIGVLSFSPGDFTKSFEVTIINDNVFEGLQEFSAVMTTTESQVDIFQSLARVQIIDDDGKEIDVDLYQSTSCGYIL